MNNCIISLNNELIKLNKSYLQYNNVNSYLDDLKMLLYFYSKISYNIGINLTRKKVGLDYKDFLLDDFTNTFINEKFNKINVNMNIELIIILFLECVIYVYRYSQLIEFKNNNIETIYIKYDNNSDAVVKLLSKNSASVDLIIKYLKNIKIDSYIKFDLYQIVDLSILEDIPKELKNNYTFNFVDNIYDIPVIYNSYKDSEINIMKDKFISLIVDNNVYINNKYYNYNYLLIKYTINGNLKLNKYWSNKFNKEHNFISYRSLKNAYQYMLENYILYFLDKNTLLKIDEENFNYIKKHILASGGVL